MRRRTPILLTVMDDDVAAPLTNQDLFSAIVTDSAPAAP
jgi:hypothetical protein